MTSRWGWVLLGGAVVLLGLAFMVSKYFVLASLACSVGAACFEKDYPSGF